MKWIIIGSALALLFTIACLAVWKSRDAGYVDLSAPEIIQASQSGDFESVRRIIGADPSQLIVKNSKGNSAAHCAILNDRTDIAIYLIEKGYPVNPRSGAEFPLIMCCVSRYTLNSEIMLKYLIEHGANVNVLYEPEGWLPLNMAVNNGMESKVRILVQSGADLDAKDRTGLTPMELAKQCVEQFKDLKFNLPHGEFNDPGVRKEAVEGWERMVRLIGELEKARRRVRVR